MNLNPEASPFLRRRLRGWPSHRFHDTNPDSFQVYVESQRAAGDDRRSVRGAGVSYTTTQSTGVTVCFMWFFWYSGMLTCLRLGADCC